MQEISLLPEMNVLPVQWIRYEINNEKLPQTLISVYNFRCSLNLRDTVIVVIFWNWLYTIKQKQGKFVFAVALSFPRKNFRVGAINSVAVAVCYRRRKAKLKFRKSAVADCPLFLILDCVSFSVNKNQNPKVQLKNPLRIRALIKCFACILS